MWVNVRRQSASSSGKCLLLGENPRLLRLFKMLFMNICASILFHTKTVFVETSKGRNMDRMTKVHPILEPEEPTVFATTTGEDRITRPSRMA